MGSPDDRVAVITVDPKLVHKDLKIICEALEQMSQDLTLCDCNRLAGAIDGATSILEAVMETIQQFNQRDLCISQSEKRKN